MIQLNNVTKSYKLENGSSVCALDRVSVNFGNKGLIFIVGKSGSGKSSLLNIIGGLDVPNDGEFIVEGRNSKNFSASDLDSYRNTFIGFIFQEYNLMENYTVGANIGLALELQGKRAEKSEIEEVMRRVDLVEQGNSLCERKINELSGGQKQRVAIARAIVKSPHILLAVNRRVHWTVRQESNSMSYSNSFRGINL